MNKALERLGRLAARRHWVVVGLWLVVLAGLVAGRHAFGGEYVNNYNVPGSQSSLGSDALKADFTSQSGYAGQIVFHAKSGTVAQQQSAVNQATANVKNLPDVITAVSPFATANSPAVSKSGTIAYSTVSWSANPASLDTSYLDKLNKAVAPARSAGLQVEYGGGAGQIGQATHDLKSEVIGLICALLLLLFMFGSVIAAAIPLVSAIFSVLAGLSVVGLLGAAVTFPTTAPTVATLLGLGVAVDYGLFLVARHREQVDAGMDPIESAAKAEGSAGASVVVAGSTVVVSILGLYISGVPFVGAMGLASAIVVAITMLAALTLVPAFLGTARSSIRSLAARYRARHAGISAREEARRTAAQTHEHHEHSLFARWGRRVSDQPWIWGTASIVVLAVLAIPLFSLRMGQLDAGTNPTSDSSRRAYDLVKEGFGPGANGPLNVVVKLPKQSSADNTSLLNSLQTSLAKTADVASVSPATVNGPGTVAVINVIPASEPQASATTTLVNTIRDDVLPSVHATTYLTGFTAGSVDFTERTAQRMLWLILAVVAISFVLLTVAFRSVIIPIKAAILNLLSVGAAYGVIVAVFQWGWGSGVFGIGEKLPIPAYVPMMVFAIVFGLSMDYEVFLLSRVHESWIALRDAHRAVAIGIGATARVITTAAAIMVVVFASFLLDSDPSVKMLALGMAVAVLIDATIVRMMLVPSAMSVLGEHAWWMPAWLDRIVPRIQLEGPIEGPGTASAPADVSAPAEKVGAPAGEAGAPANGTGTSGNGADTSGTGTSGTGAPPAPENALAEVAAEPEAAAPPEHPDTPQPAG